MLDSSKEPSAYAAPRRVEHEHRELIECAAGGVIPFSDDVLDPAVFLGTVDRKVCRFCQLKRDLYGCTDVCLGAVAS